MYTGHEQRTAQRILRFANWKRRELPMPNVRDLSRREYWLLIKALEVHNRIDILDLKEEAKKDKEESDRAGNNSSAARAKKLGRRPRRR